MKKFTFILSLFLTCVGAMAQSITFTPVEGVDNLTSGIYQIRVGNGNGYGNYHQGAKGYYLSVAVQGNGASSAFNCQLLESPANEGLTLFYVTKLDNGNITIKASDGKYMNGSGQLVAVADGATPAEITVANVSGEDADQFKLSSTMMAWTWNSGATYYLGFSSSTNSNYANARLQFSKVESEGLETIVSGVEHGKLGYPTDEAYNALVGSLASGDATPENIFDNLVEYFATPVVLPEDGKVYRIKSVINYCTTSGETVGNPVHYLCNNGGTISFPTSTTEGNVAEYWVCQASADDAHRTFVSASADVSLAWKALGVNAFNYEVKAGSTFGNFSLWNATAVRALAVTNEAFTSGMGFNHGSAGVQSTNWSTEFVLEEVEESEYTGYTVTTTASIDGKSYATLNLPFATTVPEGVTANSVALGDAGNSLEPTELELTEGVLPANTPVLLTSTTAGEFTFAPAAACGTTAVETGLQGTLAAAAVSGNAYILAKLEGNEEVKFYLLDSEANTVNANKAYYVGASSVRALALGNGLSTGIETVAGDTAADAPLYDLQGRRVQKAAAGIYLQGGKKVFVK